MLILCELQEIPWHVYVIGLDKEYICTKVITVFIKEELFVVWMSLNAIFVFMFEIIAFTYGLREHMS